MPSWQRERYNRSSSTTLQASQSFLIGSAGLVNYVFEEDRYLTFAQEDTAPPPVVKRPNPQNEKNMATLQELEEEVQR
jgi:hypothetical protein